MRGTGGFPTSDGASHINSTENIEILKIAKFCGIAGGSVVVKSYTNLNSVHFISITHQIFYHQEYKKCPLQQYIQSCVAQSALSPPYIYIKYNIWRGKVVVCATLDYTATVTVEDLELTFSYIFYILYSYTLVCTYVHDTTSAKVGIGSYKCRNMDPYPSHMHKFKYYYRVSCCHIPNLAPWTL